MLLESSWVSWFSGVVDSGVLLTSLCVVWFCVVEGILVEYLVLNEQRVRFVEIDTYVNEKQNNNRSMFLQSRYLIHGSFCSVFCQH